LGVSREAESKVQDVFIDKLGARYPIALVDNNATADYGIRFYPSIYGIEPDGTVFSVPDDRMPSEADIERLLEFVTLAPRMPEDAKYDALRSMWEKKQHLKINDYLAKMLAQDNLDAELREVFELQQKELQKRVASKLEAVDRLAAGPDYFRATEKLKAMEKEWKGFTVADKAKAELARFKKDAAIKKEVAAGKALQKLLSRYDRSKVSQARKLTGALLKFAKRYKGTHAGERAQRMLDSGG